MRVVAVDAPGLIKELRVDPGEHTILLDTTRLAEIIIAKFVNELTKRGGHHSANARSEDMAIAIGWFDVPLSAFYDDKEISSIAQLDDTTLSMIVRLRMEKEMLDKEKTDD